MMTFDEAAQWIGYFVMVSCGGIFVVALVCFFADYFWRTFWRDIPNMGYMIEAVNHYKTIKPPPGRREDGEPTGEQS